MLCCRSIHKQRNQEILFYIYPYSCLDLLIKNVNYYTSHKKTSIRDYENLRKFFLADNLLTDFDENLYEGIISKSF